MNTNIQTFFGEILPGLLATLRNEPVRWLRAASRRTPRRRRGMNG
ncbi:hypothetical protein [Devosia nitrariae]|nr:hypothetical protein [Devosia nitrariae]